MRAWPRAQSGGVFGAGLLLALAQVAPTALEAARSAGGMPLPVRLLYGGISEEVLVRWGLMTGCLWALWRAAQRGKGAPRTGLVGAAIVASALLFGAGHLPAAAAWAPNLDATVVAYVVLGNAAFGVVAGYLFWKHGLESAMLAHLAAHLLAYAAAG